MAIDVLYFGTDAAGADDGTSWANRGQLFSGGAWNPLITGKDFSAGNSLKCLIGPGTYTITATLVASLFANPPTVANLLFMHGCDSSGVQLVPSNPGWVSAQPVDWDSTLPVLATTTNIATISLANSTARLLKFTASGRNESVVGSGSFDWCYVSNSTANTAAQALGSGNNSVTNCYGECTGSNYRAVLRQHNSSNYPFFNIRLYGVTGTTGSRIGWEGRLSTSTSGQIAGITVVGVGGNGIDLTNSSVNHNVVVSRCVVANVGGNGIQGHAAASPTSRSVAQGCMVTGCGGYGVEGGNSTLLVSGSRLRSNTSGNFNGMGNYPTDFDNDVSAGTDADEYVDAAGGDFRIKRSSSLWGKGYGAGDEPGGEAAMTGAVQQQWVR